MKKPTFVDGFNIKLHFNQWYALQSILEDEHEEISNYIADEIAIYQTRPEPIGGITIYGVTAEDLSAMYDGLKAIERKMIEQAR